MWWKKRRIYLDYAAGVSGNPSSPHEEGRRAKKVLEDARTDIARLLEVQSDDVIFTSGATESNALAVLGLLKKGDHALYLPSAHASIIENMNLLVERGVEIEALPIRDVRVDTDELTKMIRPETVLVSMDAVCGETGVVWNTREVKQIIGASVLLHVDASQAVFTEKLTRAHFSADLLTLDGSKVGVRGIGALIAHRTIPLTPLYRGGGQERGLRPGSEVPELARAFAACLRQAARDREKFCTSALFERVRLIEAMTKNIPNVFLNEGRIQVPNILNISLPGRDTDYLVALLDEAGFAISTRSACETDPSRLGRSEAGSEEGSRAVFALTSDRERAKSTLRVSWNATTTRSELRSFAKTLIEEVAFIDSNN